MNNTIELAHELHALSSAGLLYTRDSFDEERYTRIREIAATLISLASCEENDGYQTPKLSTRSAIFNESDEVLLVKDYDGKWVMPGGWCDYNQTIYSNTKKEALEEAGLNVEPYRLVGLFDHRKRNNPNSFFYDIHAFMLCRLIGGEFHKNIETTQSRYFPLNALTEMNDHKTSREQID